MNFTSNCLLTLLITSVNHRTEALSIGSNPNGRVGRSSTSFTTFRGKSGQTASSESTTRLHYEPGDDVQQGATGLGNEGSGVWSALANTERWISETIAKASRGGSNPYSRKEISYVCETTDDALMAIANVFRRAKDARDLGESHSNAEEALLKDKGSGYNPSTLRQTHVVVIPWCEYFTSFKEFQGVIQAINRARRSARDYVTNMSLEKLDMEKKGLAMNRDWMVGVSLASLHPKYGEPTPAETLSEMKKEEKDGEVDLNLQAYREQKKLAYRSPYPTVVLEVKAIPPPENFGNSSPPPQTQALTGMNPTDPSNNASDRGEVSSEDVKRLEILFGKSAEMLKGNRNKNKDKNKEDSFYDKIGEVDGIEEVMSDSSIIATQKWVTLNDPTYKREGSTFAMTDAKHVDSAYEVIFTNLAMQARSMREKKKEEGTSDKFSRTHIIMPHFLTSSATSFEKFASEVTNIIGKVKGLEGVSVDIFHPEHINIRRQCELPVFVMQWKEK